MQYTVKDCEFMIPCKGVKSGNQHFHAGKGREKENKAGKDGQGTPMAFEIKGARLKILPKEGQGFLGSVFYEQVNDTQNREEEIHQPQKRRHNNAAFHVHQGIKAFPQTSLLSGKGAYAHIGGDQQEEDIFGSVKRGAKAHVSDIPVVSLILGKKTGRGNLAHGLFLKERLIISSAGP
ncbi:MAG: hypothetical protein ACK4NR_07150 [Micavibrio sp.]